MNEEKGSLLSCVVMFGKVIFDKKSLWKDYLVVRSRKFKIEINDWFNLFNFFCVCLWMYCSRKFN